MALLQRSEDVALEVKRRIGRILQANDFETDAGASVRTGRVAGEIDKSQVPCTIVIEGEDAPARIKVGLLYQVVQSYMLISFVPCDPDDPNAGAHKALRDHKRAVFLSDDGKPDTTWGGKVKDVEYLGRDLAPRDDGEAFVMAVTLFAVTFVENLAAP